MQYSARSARLSVQQVFTSYIRRGLVSRDSIVNGDWLPATERCQRYLPCYLFSFQFRPAFLPRRSASWHSGVLGLPNIGRGRKIWGVLYGVYRPGK